MDLLSNVNKKIRMKNNSYNGLTSCCVSIEMMKPSLRRRKIMLSFLFSTIFGMIFFGLVLLLGVAAMIFGIVKVIAWMVKEMRSAWTGKGKEGGN